MLPLAIITLRSPEGPFHLAVSALGVVGARRGGSEEAFRAGLPAHTQPDERASATLAGLRPIVEAAVEGAPVDLAAIPLDVRHRPAWDAAVLRAVQAIPWGRTASYGEIARRAGSPRAARAAGGAIRRCDLDVVVPCHRVIAADGSLGGYGGDGPADRDEALERKRLLLMREGRTVLRRRV